MRSYWMLLIVVVLVLGYSTAVSAHGGGHDNGDQHLDDNQSSGAPSATSATLTEDETAKGVIGVALLLLGAGVLYAWWRRSHSS